MGMDNRKEEMMQEDIFTNKELMYAIEQLKKGDKKGFETIYQQTYKYVYSRSKAILKNEEEVLDLVQEVYLAVYRNIDSLKSNESFYAWLRTITFQQSTKLMRKNGKELLLTEGDEELFDAMMDENTETDRALLQQEDVKAIKECINRLSEEHRTVILAYYYDCLKVEEIAEVLEVSVGTVKSRLYSARKKLQLYIEKQEKKQGYKLHSFSGFTFVFFMGAWMQENMKGTESHIDLIFESICKELGFTCSGVDVSSNFTGLEQAGVKEMGKKAGKSFFSKIAEIGAKKMIAITVGSVAVTGVTGAVLVEKNVIFHTHEYVSVISENSTCEFNGVKTFTCECGDSYTEEIFSTGHSFENYVSNEDATYLADGTETGICECGLKDTRIVEGSKKEYTYTDLEKVMYVTSNVDARTMPSEDGDEVKELVIAYEVKITGKCNENSWYRIELEDEVAYVNGDYLTDENPNLVADNDKEPEKKPSEEKHPEESQQQQEEPQQQQQEEVQQQPEEQVVDDGLFPAEREAIAAGYYNVILSSEGYYVVLLHEDDSVGKGEELINAYLAQFGYEIHPESGGGHMVGDDMFIYVVNKIQKPGENVYYTF